MGTDDSKAKIELWQSCGFALLLEYPSGVLYSNQTGGTSCWHPEIEGVYIPLANALTEPGLDLFGPGADLFRYFEGPKHMGTGATYGLDEDDARFIEERLSFYSLDSMLAVDREKLRESHEAWVWVIVTGEEGRYGRNLFHGFGPYPRAGVLTWNNTD